MIKIASLMITRRCNLRCEYCRISGDVDYILKPSEYPDSKYYYQNEKDYHYWNSVIDKIFIENNDVFFLIVGGEPFVYKDLDEIVIHLNSLGANYTIISNCTDSLEKSRNKFFEKVGKVKGFTCSVDPVSDYNDDVELKSQQGFNTMVDLMSKGLIEDPVAEITVDKDTVYNLEETVKRLSDNGIYSDITTLDISKTNYYDFSTIIDPQYLVPKSNDVEDIFNRLINSDYKIHMKEILLQRIYNILPADNMCNLKKGNIHNVTIDSDGKLRLCYRIRGRSITQFDALDYFDVNKREKVEEAFEFDYNTLCKGCAWTCMLMSIGNEEESRTILSH